MIFGWVNLLYRNFDDCIYVAEATTVDVFCNGYSSAVLWLLFKSYSTDPELENVGKMTFFACYCLDAHISSFD